MNSSSPETQSRPWLIVLDVDGVVLRSHFLLEMSRHVGIWAHLRGWGFCFLFNAGVLPFSRLLALIYARFAGQTEGAARAVFGRMTLIPNAGESIAALQRQGHWVTAVSSGVPDAFLADLAQSLHLDGHAGIELGLGETDGTRVLDGTVSGDLTAPGGKIAAVEKMHATFGTDWPHTIVVADDRNNLELLDRAEMSVGVRPNWPIRRAAAYVADQGDMAEVRGLIESYLSGQAAAPPNHETLRKWIHASGALVPFAADVSKVGTTVALTVVMALYALSEVWRLNGLSLPGFTWVTRHTVRPGELRRPSLGPVFLALGCLTCLWCFPWPTAAGAILLASLGDTAAAVFGRRWGRHRLFYSPKKSLEGTAAFFVTSLAVTCWLLPLPACLAACAVGALLESLPLGDGDNIVVPLGAAAAATWVQQILG